LEQGACFAVCLELVLTHQPSTGGIIALGLAAKRWSVAYCIQTFLGLCQQAFTEREFHDIPLLQQAATLNHGSKWKTRPFHDALRSAFGMDEVLYGGKHEDTAGYTIKVAATSTSRTGQQALLLANYNRQEDRHCEYKMDFASTAEHSLKIWEVAAATSAAPSFFKPFRSLTNDSTYLDGALFHNNPVKVANSERKILWPDVAEKHPDIFLSVGTGQNLKKMELELERNVKTLASSEAKKKTSKVIQLESNKNKRRHQVWKGVKDFFSVLVGLHHKALSC
jgi:patatin-like phospholipase/acyl hydrolase